MPIDPVKIPQNVYVEEHIVGPITLRQIIFVMIGGGVSYALWSTVKAAGGVSIMATALSWTPMPVAAAFAFVKVNDITLFRLCILMLERMEKPNRRMWTPRRGIEINIQTMVETKQKNTNESAENQAKRKRLEELSSVLDRGPDTMEDEQEQEETAVRVTAKEDTEERSLPVRKESIAVSPREPQSSVDGLSVEPTQSPAPNNPTGLLRDIHPPA